MSKIKQTDARVGGPGQADQSTWTTVFDMPLDELERRVAQAGSLMQQAVGLFPGLHAMTDEERKMSNGRIRFGEGTVFLTLIKIAEAFPQYFEGIADRDMGVDPDTVETPLMRERVQRAEIIAGLLDTAEQFRGVSDTVLHLRELVRDPMKEIYAISKVMSNTNPALKLMLVPVINFYAGLARMAMAARTAKAEAEAAAKAAAAKQG